MKGKVLFYLALTLAMVCLSLHAMERARGMGHANSLLYEGDALNRIREMRISKEQLAQFREWGDEAVGWIDYLCMHLITGQTEQKQLRKDCELFRRIRGKDYEAYRSYLAAAWEDLKHYPIPAPADQPQLTVSYVDSWMYERTYGGKRGHEGCDMMASYRERGHYPVLSMTDGVVEQVGWLPLGGYRIGIRAPHGGYFYYAHLYDYAREFQPGDPVRAGEWIGFMGDSGYSEAEGTVGNFDVHLHVGIYVNQPDGTELSLNPYAALQDLEGSKLAYRYE